MDRLELLQKIKEENESREPYLRDSELVAIRIGAIAAIAVAVLFFIIELIITGEYNVGLFLSVTAMLAFGYTAYAFRVRSVFNTVMAVLFSLIFVVLVVFSVIGFLWGVI